MMRELPISPPEPVEITECAYCGGEIYEGDEVAYSRKFGGFVHSGDGSECVREFAYDIVYDERGVIDRDCNVN